jgi:hypothetical protein
LAFGAVKDGKTGLEGSRNLTQNQAHQPNNFRHGRACPGHPRFYSVRLKFVDARDKAGHDED